MSLSKDYKRIVYHMAKDCLAHNKTPRQNLSEWWVCESTATDHGVILGYVSSHCSATPNYSYKELQDFTEEMFVRDVENIYEELKAKVE